MYTTQYLACIMNFPRAEVIIIVEAPNISTLWILLSTPVHPGPTQEQLFLQILPAIWLCEGVVSKQGAIGSEPYF